MRKTFVILVLSLMFVSITGGASAQESPSASSLEKVTAYVQPSIVFLEIKWTGWIYDTYNKSYLNDGDPFTLYFSCTGFVVNPDGYIATAGHCVDPINARPYFLDEAAQWVVNNDYYAVNPGYATARKWAETDYRIEGENKSAGGAYKKSPDLAIQAAWSTTDDNPIYNSQGELSGDPHPARVVSFLPWNDGAGDTAVLKVEVTDLPALPLAPEGSVTTGTEVISVGYPASVGDVTDTSLSAPSFKEGTISSVRTSGVYPVYEISASLSGGMSGGPTVDSQGRVVGINSFGINGETQSFNFIQASTTLDGVMTDQGVDNTLGEIGSAYRSGLDAYYAGEKEVAVERLSAAVALDSDFEMASQYLAKAQALPDPSSPIVPIAIGVGILALAGVGLFFGGKKIKGRKKVVAGDSVVPPTTTWDATTATGFCSSCGAKSTGAPFCSRCGAKN